MVYLVFRATECYAVLVSSLGRVMSSISLSPQVRLGLELVKMRFVKINLTYNLTLTKPLLNLTLTKPIKLGQGGLVLV